MEFTQRPGLLLESLEEHDKLVVLDEVQRLPILLNEVHKLIEDRGIKFLLTGSSARSLRRKGANLLGGRASTRYFHPLTSKELGGKFSLNKALSNGMIPSIYFSTDPKDDLESYCGDYLQQEIIAEAAARDIPGFSRFLKVAALCNATIVNFTNFASDAQVKRTTLYEYFEILKDTLILHELPAFKSGKKRKPISSSKYYFFDNGVVRSLQGRESYTEGTSEYGLAFETMIFHELIAFRDYIKRIELSFWRTGDYEVDFIIDDHTAIEVKGKKIISPDDLKSLKAIAEEQHFKKLICVGQESRPRKVGDIEILPYEIFLQRLWKGEIV